MRKSSDYFFRQALAVILLVGVLWLTAQIACAQEKVETISAKDKILWALKEKPFVTNTVMELETLDSTQVIFRIESNLAEAPVNEKDVFWGLHKFGQEDIVANLYHNIGQLIGKWLCQEKDTIICSSAIFFAVQNLIFRKPKTQKAMVALVTTSCFFSGIGYGLLSV